MVVVALLAWIVPPTTLGLTVWQVARSSRVGSAMKNAIATGVAAASMVLVFFYLVGTHRHGPWSDEPKLGSSWRVPVFACLAAGFAWCAGWATATLYLAVRQAARGRWRQPGCPNAMQTALALVTLLGLLFTLLPSGYSPAWRWAARSISIPSSSASCGA